jgi:two-component system response regulator RegA
MTHILLVDDDDIFLQVLQRAFTKRNYHVAIATDIATAMEHCHSGHFEQAVIDLKIDSESGLQLIQKIAEYSPNTKIVMLTGYSSISTAVEAIKLGAVNYLCKPADANDIIAAFAHADGNTDMAISLQPPSVDRLEWEHIQKVLQEHEGNVSATARALGMHRRTLQRKLQKRPVKK